MFGYGRGRGLPKVELARPALEASYNDSDKTKDTDVGIQSSGLTANTRRIGFGRRGQVLPSGSHKVPALGATASSGDTISTNSQDENKSNEEHPKDLVNKDFKLE